MSPSKSPDHSKTPFPSQLTLEELVRSTNSTDIEKGIPRVIRKTKLFNGSLGLRSSSSNKSGYENLKDISPHSIETFELETNCVKKNEEQSQPKEKPDNPVLAMEQRSEESETTGFSGLSIPKKKRLQSLKLTVSPYNSKDTDPQLNNNDGDDSRSYLAPDHSERTPLTGESLPQRANFSEEVTTDRQRNDKLRVSFHEAKYQSAKDNSRHKDPDDELADTEAGLSSTFALSPLNHRKNRLPPMSPNASIALSRAGSRVRAISQRVVNISGEAGMIEATAHLEAKREEDRLSIYSKTNLENPYDESDSTHEQKRRTDSIATKLYPIQYLPTAPIEKAMCYFGTVQPSINDNNPSKKSLPNPLRGKTLGIFSPESRVRNILCDLLVYPLTEPIILILIVIQTIILATESSQKLNGKPRIMAWGSSPMDYALLVIFIIFTFELAARIIVSGFIFNASEYSIRKAQVKSETGILARLRAIFQPRESTPKKPHNPTFGIQAQSRSLSVIQGKFVQTVEQAQRLLLAKRAFLRHSFNRLDFVAVCSYWVALILCLTGIEENLHLHFFRMLSCLRILRLLALTNGTAVSVLLNYILLLLI